MENVFSTRHSGCRRGTHIIAAVVAWLVPVLAWAQVFKPLRDDIPSQKFQGSDVVAVLTGQVTKGVLGAVGAVALLMIMYGGWQILIGGKTSEDRINNGKKTILWAAIGLVAVFAAYALASTLLARITGATGLEQR